jgi:hypothetical protein
MGYYIDLSSINLEQYKETLKTVYLPPSRTILRENLEERFNAFKSAGITNVKELVKALKHKNKFDEFGKFQCFKGNYLTILLRELNSILPKPNKLVDFKGISVETITKLERVGIKNTQTLYVRVINKSARTELAKETGISEAEILELTKLTDLSRIKWAGATFARMLHDIGFDTVKKVAEANYEELHQKIRTLNKDKGYFKGNIGLNDIRVFVDAAKDVPLDIEY